jgi:hypothetical protein
LIATSANAILALLVASSKPVFNCLYERGVHVIPSPFAMRNVFRSRCDTTFELHGARFKGLGICGTGCFVTCADLGSPRIFGGRNGLIHVAANAFFISAFKLV